VPLKVELGMSAKVLVKLVALLTALTATVVAMFWLKQGHMDAFWTSLGVDRSGTRINWCEERVSQILVYESGSKLLEKDGKWIWANSEENVLDYLRIEKWFAKYCQVSVTIPENYIMVAPNPLVEVAFLDGNRLTIYEIGGAGLYKIRDKIFQSESLKEGLKELLAFDKKVQ
jgi:hypothetical protein